MRMAWNREIRTCMDGLVFDEYFTMFGNLLRAVARYLCSPEAEVA
jgi:hypothetical protein